MVWLSIRPAIANSSLTSWTIPSETWLPGPINAFATLRPADVVLLPIRLRLQLRSSVLQMRPDLHAHALALTALSSQDKTYLTVLALLLLLNLWSRMPPTLNSLESSVFADHLPTALAALEASSSQHPLSQSAPLMILSHFQAASVTSLLASLLPPTPQRMSMSPTPQTRAPSSPQTLRSSLSTGVIALELTMLQWSSTTMT
jgi:hypothetical protein